jgi:hypothetical protein
LEFCHQRQVTRSPVSFDRGADDEGIVNGGLESFKSIFKESFGFPGTAGVT